MDRQKRDEIERRVASMTDRDVYEWQEEQDRRIVDEDCEFPNDGKTRAGRRYRRILRKRLANLRSATVRDLRGRIRYGLARAARILRAIAAS